MTTCTQCQSEILNEKEPYRSSSFSIEKAPRRSLRSYLGSIPKPSLSPRIKLTLKITAALLVAGIPLAVIAPHFAVKIGAGILCLIGGIAGIYALGYGLVKLPFHLGCWIGINVFKWDWRDYDGDIKSSLDFEPWSIGILTMGAIPAIYFLGDLVVRFIP